MLYRRNVSDRADRERRKFARWRRFDTEPVQVFAWMAPPSSIAIRSKSTGQHRQRPRCGFRPAIPEPSAVLNRLPRHLKQKPLLRVDARRLREARCRTAPGRSVPRWRRIRPTGNWSCRAVGSGSVVFVGHPPVGRHLGDSIDTIREYVANSPQANACCPAIGSRFPQPQSARRSAGRSQGVLP